MSVVDYNSVQNTISMRGFSDLGNGKFGFRFKFHYGVRFFTEIMSALYEIQKKCYDLDAEVHSFKTEPGYILDGGLATIVNVVIKSKNSISYSQK